MEARVQEGYALFQGHGVRVYGLDRGFAATQDARVGPFTAALHGERFQRLPAEVRHRGSSDKLVLLVFANWADSSSDAGVVRHSNKVVKCVLFAKSLFNIHADQRTAAGGASTQI